MSDSQSPHWPPLAADAAILPTGSNNGGLAFGVAQYSFRMQKIWAQSMTPHQRDVQIKMWATGLNRLSGLCFGAAIFGVFGMRFVDHQVKIGLIAGALLFFAGMHVVRYISPDEEGESAS